jgi:MFS family permease
MLDRFGFGHFQKALSHRDYRLFAGANLLSAVGTWMQRVGVGWLAWEYTHSSFWVGLVAFMDFFPVVLLGLIAGAITDRVNVQNLFRISQWAMLGQAAALAILSMMGVLEISGLIALALIQGVAFSFDQPSRHTIVSLILPRADLPAGIALNTTSVSAARFIGPAIAGAIIVGSGPTLIFTLNALSYLPMIWWLSRGTILRAVEPAPKVSFFKSISEGIHYVTRHAGIGILFL